jgi:type II secretory pathway predicted ATPase ExeA
MYESLYALSAKPFSLLPDPEFLFLSGRHKSGLDILEYGLLNRAVFTVLTGEPGTGKTTLLNKILDENRGRCTVGVIGTTYPSDDSLLPWVADAFGLDCAGRDTVGYFRMMTSFLGRTFAEGRQVLLVVDEAQNLSLQMLEDLRLLSNLNDGRQAGLQIILAGQPSLRALLTRSDMRQFAQRITGDYALEPLNEDDTQAYIRHRLAVAGGDPDLFTDYACSIAHRFSGGIPRLINQLCDLSLVYGFGEGAERITATIMLQVVSDRAAGGLLPHVVDPKTIQLDPDRLARESQPVRPAPILARQASDLSSPASTEASAKEDGGGGHYLDSMGDAGEARAQRRKIHEIDPLYPDISVRVAARDKPGLFSFRRGSLFHPMSWLRSFKERWS